MLHFYTVVSLWRLYVDVSFLRVATFDPPPFPLKRGYPKLSLLTGGLKIESLKSKVWRLEVLTLCHLKSTKFGRSNITKQYRWDSLTMCTEPRTQFVPKFGKKDLLTTVRFDHRTFREDSDPGLERRDWRRGPWSEERVGSQARKDESELSLCRRSLLRISRCLLGISGRTLNPQTNQIKKYLCFIRSFKY